MTQARKIPQTALCLAALMFAETASAATVLTEADANTNHVIPSGETIELRLKENPSTGYVWNVTFDPPNAAAVTGSHWTANSGAIGAPGVRDLSITIRQPGNLIVRAKNGRSWEGEDSVTKRLEFHIETR